MAIARVYRET